MRECTTVKPAAVTHDIPSERDLLLQLREDLNHVLRYVRQRELIDELKQRDNLELLATRDPLTQLADRRLFRVRAAQLEASKSPYLIALIDIDDFKLVNDLFGHREGDRVLTIFAAGLSEIVRAGDLVARYGGEEFGILFTDISVEAASQIMQRFIDSLAGLLKREGAQPVTASVGLNSSEADSFRAKFQEADNALSEAKRQGKKPRSNSHLIAWHFNRSE